MCYLSKASQHISGTHTGQSILPGSPGIPGPWSITPLVTTSAALHPDPNSGTSRLRYTPLVHHAYGPHLWYITPVVHTSGTSRLRSTPLVYHACGPHLWYITPAFPTSGSSCPGPPTQEHHAPGPHPSKHAPSPHLWYIMEWW